jgi:hypothetical protein
MSIAGSHVAEDARCTVPFDSVTHPILDETAGMPGSEESTGSDVGPAEATGGILITAESSVFVGEVDDVDGCGDPAQPCTPSATRMEKRSES